jgi:hypothetical protein
MLVLPTDRLLIAGKYGDARKMPGGRAVNFHAFPCISMHFHASARQRAGRWVFD